MSDTSPKVLRIDASGRHAGSQSRALADVLTGLLTAPGQVVTRDLALAAPRLVHEDWIAANFTPADDRTPAQRDVLADSDALVDELEAVDALVLASPIYNFGVPAALKAWIDQVGRVGRTFRYTAAGPEGLLTGKRAYVVMASGGTPIGSEIDFASGYLRHFLGFLGITDVTVLAAADFAGSDDVEAALREKLAGIGAAA